MNYLFYNIKRIWCYCMTIRRNNTIERCKKKIDNTSLKLVKGKKHTDYFNEQFSNNEPYMNMKFKNMLRLFDKGTYIVDVNANVGEKGLYLAYHLQKSYKDKLINVIMIEPDESKTKFIEEMILLNNLNNCTILTCGVSNRECSGNIVEHPSNNYKKTIIKECEDGIIPIYTIDKLCEFLEISLMNVDILKYKDIYKMLEGSNNTLKNVKYLIVDKYCYLMYKKDNNNF